MMPLSLAAVGVEQMVKQIQGCGKTSHHLGNLGFTVGGTVMVISELGGDLIVNVKDTRIAISKNLAHKIMVGKVLKS